MEEILVRNNSLNAPIDQVDREADVVQCGYEAGGTVHVDVVHVRPVKRRLCRG